VRRIEVWFSALRFAWKQKPFRWWIGICTAGITVGLLLNIGMTKLVILVAIACIGWGMEIANSAVEELCNIVNPQYSEKVKIVKDAFAAVPIFVYSAYVISWLILVSPAIIEWVIK
jgi:undecaprenol kinase/diacylglycerol kinase (ATP)